MGGPDNDMAEASSKSLLKVQARNSKSSRQMLKFYLPRQSAKLGLNCGKCSTVDDSLATKNMRTKAGAKLD